MSDWYRYKPGRELFKGVEILEYTKPGRYDEALQVVAWAPDMRRAQNICMFLNRQITLEKTPITKAEPLPGSY